MENKQKEVKYLFYLAKTRFKAGIFLTQDAIPSVKGVVIMKFESFAEAIEGIRRIESIGDFLIDWGAFYPNKFYKLFDDRIYTVIYDKFRVGFIQDKNCLDFINKKNFRQPFFKCLRKMTYAQAQQKTYALGALVRGNEIVIHDCPRCGHVYYRKRE